MIDAFNGHEKCSDITGYDDATISEQLQVIQLRHASSLLRVNSLCMQQRQYHSIWRSMCEENRFHINFVFLGIRWNTTPFITPLSAV